jgi:hypothetical protein
MHKHLFFGMAVGSALLASGCAPERGEIGGNIETDRMAVLAGDEGGQYDILIMDLAGNELETVDANLSQATSLTWHPDGFFLVTEGMNIGRIDMDGGHSIFNRDPLPSSYLYRLSVSDDGDVTASEEYDSTELDPEGEIINHTNTGGTYCWTDTALGLDGDAPVLLDVFASVVAVWEDGAYDVLASGVGSGASIMGRDDSGRYWTTGYDGNLSTVDSSGEVSHVGNLAQMGVSSWSVTAIEPAGADSVLALYQGQTGTGIARVDSDGNAEEVLSAGASYWLDMTVF